MGEKITFFKNFIQQPSRVGAVAPSSKALVKMMIESFEWSDISHVIEYGPGTGVFTEAIVKNIEDGATFFAIEQSTEMVAATKQRCPSAQVYCDSVTNVRELCKRESIDKVDAIVSGLPWASFPSSLQHEIMGSITEVLRPGGKFATFAYWQGLALPAGQRFASKLRDTFSIVERSPTVWKNLPPAFVYRCVL